MSIRVFTDKEINALIRLVIEKYHLTNMVSYLCELAGVSRSGYQWNLKKMIPVQYRNHLLKSA